MRIPSLYPRPTVRATTYPAVAQHWAPRRYAQSQAVSDLDIMQDALQPEETPLPDTAVNKKLPSGTLEPSYYASIQPTERQAQRYSAIKPNSFIKPADFSYHSRRLRKSSHSVPYAPHGKKARYSDPFVQFNIDPRYTPENTKLLGAFVTEMGKIEKRAITGLSIRSQRMVGKAIKRSRMMGLLPLFCRPERLSKK
ncbi:hypothetical protein BD410DRAFT_892711 [Rickenella mellea]|uniref:Small ribosomal subunit protein bS18m n=1 Tax=Rickenella mellea TaxID=50990 RepID=A0A4R5XEG7_9AGAM|nr:hypothetical protein BD410DRAFT_892711 [Rickenella mellea]